MQLTIRVSFRILRLIYKLIGETHLRDLSLRSQFMVTFSTRLKPAEEAPLHT